MGCDAGFVRDKGIAGDPAQAACPGPILSGPDKVLPDRRATQIRIDIPLLGIGNGAAALGMVAKAQPGEARQPCPGPAGNRDDGVPRGRGKTGWDLPDRIHVVRPQGTSQAPQFPGIGQGGGPDPAMNFAPDLLPAVYGPCPLRTPGS